MDDAINILDVVALSDDLPERGLTKGQIGTVVESLDPGVFEVEFSDEAGRAYASLALNASQLYVLKKPHDEQVGKLSPELVELLSNSLDAMLARTNELRELAPEDFLRIVNKVMQEVGLRIPIPIPIEVVQFRSTLNNESDRGCALSAAAFIETELGDLVETSLIEDTNVTKEMFRGTGPLATFSSRIDIAYLLGLFGKRARKDLHLIRKIRNEFAHKPGDVKFTDEAIASRCRELYHDAYEEDLPPRQKFVRVSMGILGIIEAAKFKAERPDTSDDVEVQEPDFRMMSDKLRAELQTQIEHLKN